jgi:1-acyl-sn-glycerol-3-phosphate acyltransferase
LLLYVCKKETQKNYLVICNHMKAFVNILWVLYLIVLFLPISIIATLITAIITIVMCSFGNHRIWGYLPGKYWSKLMCYLAFITVEVKGKEQLNPNQSYIFAANHQSLYDIFLIYGWIGFSFKWIMKMEIRKMPFIGAACKSAGHIFIDRSNPMKALQSIEIAKKILTQGVSLAIFPEGSRTRTGEMGKFKRGAFQIAKDVQLPIVPVSIHGGYKIMPVSRWYPISGKLTLTIHSPVSFSPISHEEELEMINSIQNTIKESLS